MAKEITVIYPDFTWITRYPQYPQNIPLTILALNHLGALESSLQKGTDEREASINELVPLNNQINTAGEEGFDSHVE